MKVKTSEVPACEALRSSITRWSDCFRGPLPSFVAIWTFVVCACQNPSSLPSTASSEFSRLYGKRDSSALELASDPATLVQTKQRVARRTELVRGRLAEISDVGEIDDLEDELEILTYLDGVLGKTIVQRQPEQKALSINVQAERILNLLENEDAGSRAAHRFPEMLRGMLPTALLGHRLPARGKGAEHVALGERGASKESAFLYDPARSRFFSKNEIATMSPLQVARLDVSPSHPAWIRRESLNSDPVTDFGAKMERGLLDTMRRKGDLPENARWDLQSSRKILFLNEVYKSATSAKAKVEDPYGIEWKIKWGDEVQSEAVSSRLLLMVGAKMADLVHTGGGGPDEMILILCENGAYNADDKEEREPCSLEQLVEALDDFYGFDIGPYIHSHGVIDENNAGRLLRNLPDSALKKHRRDQLTGRHWVSFREFSLELRPEGHIRTLDGATLDDLGAMEDRAARGLYLFNLWLSGRDAKDDNNKTYFMRTGGESGGKDAIRAHYEGVHDLGVTLGAMGSAARINAMTVGEDFLSESMSGRVIVGRQTFIYKPRAFGKATWSDCRWMAERIAGLSDSQIRQAVAASRWPNFMRDTLSYKIAARRNQIARVFGVDGSNFFDSVAPEISIDLSSSVKIRAAEQKYGLTAGSLANQLANSSLSHGGIETLIREGKVVSSDESALIRELVIQRFPAGLTDRYRRMLNLHPKALREKDTRRPTAMMSRRR
jgi:hypothetical protein